MAQSNTAFLKMLHATNEALKGKQICSACLLPPPENALTVEYDGDTPHWYCPNCKIEWKGRRVWYGPKGTITPIDEVAYFPPTIIGRCMLDNAFRLARGQGLRPEGVVFAWDEEFY